MLLKRRSRGAPVPALDAVPELFADLTSFWAAWNELHASRPTGFGPSPLSVSDIVAYLDLRQIDDADLRAEYFQMIKAMDSTWLEWARDKVAAEPPKK